MTAVFFDYATVSHGDLDFSTLQRSVPGLEMYPDTDELQAPERIAGALIAIVNKVQITRALLEQAPHLRLIAVAATGTNNVDLEAARERGIAVCNIRDYCTPSVVQHVLGAMLLLTHRFNACHDAATQGAWAASGQFTLLDFPIRELAGRTLGVLGHGVLGRGVARAAESALGMKILVGNRPDTDPQPGRVPLDELLGRADVLSLHCPLTPATTGLIGARELALMQPDALLINTARGALVDTEALAAALRAGRLGGAAIDVLPQEPPVDGSPLFDPSIPNLLVTPHTAWAARESRQRALDEVAANIEDFLAGGSRGRVA